jgi:hypothetical protein
VTFVILGKFSLFDSGIDEELRQHAVVYTEDRVHAHELYMYGLPVNHEFGPTSLGRLRTRANKIPVYVASTHG